MTYNEELEPQRVHIDPVTGRMFDPDEYDGQQIEIDCDCGTICTATITDDCSVLEWECPVCGHRVEPNA